MYHFTYIHTSPQHNDSTSCQGERQRRSTLSQSSDLFGKYFPIDPPLYSSRRTVFWDRKLINFLNANSLKGHFIWFSSNVGVNPVIPPNGSNSSELKNRKEFPRFEVGALPFTLPLTFLFRKSRANFERNIDRLQIEVIEVDLWMHSTGTSNSEVFGGWGRVPFNEPYAPSLSTIYDGA